MPGEECIFKVYIQSGLTEIPQGFWYAISVWIQSTLRPAEWKVNTVYLQPQSEGLRL